MAALAFVAAARGRGVAALDSAAGGAAQNAPGGAATPSPAASLVSFQADAETAANGVYTLVGNVELDWRGIRLTADRISYDARTGEAIASGHVALDLPQEKTHIEAAGARYNFRAETGEFDDFHGVSGLRVAGRKVTLLSSNPLIFSGRRLLRLGPNHYRLEDGTITSCRLPNPKWTLSAGRVEVELGGNATLHNAVFRLFRVPVFYAPYLTHSTQVTGRHSGFLLPVIGQNSQKGTVLGDSYFWAPNRSTSLTAGADYFSARGWGETYNLESYPSRRAYVDLSGDGVFDRGIAAPGGGRIRQGGQEAHLVATFEPKGVLPGPAGAAAAASTPDDNAGAWRTVLDASYLSSFVYRLAFTENFAQAINSEVISTGFAERQFQGQDVSVTAHRYQNFLTASPSTSVSLAKFPAAEWDSADRPVATFAGAPVYFSWDLEGAALNRLEPGFNSGVLDRVDLWPRLDAPLATAAGEFMASVSARSTTYSRSLTPPPAAAGGTAPTPVLNPGQGLERFSESFSLTWSPPSLERIYLTSGGPLGDKLKHVFEPIVSYRYTGGVDNADEILRFDDRDILSDTDELDYGFVNRLYAKSGDGPARELLSWTVEQKHFFDPTFGGALRPGASNVFLTTALLTPFAFAAQPSHASPIDSVVRVSPFRGFDGDWRLDYDAGHGRLDASAFTGTFRVGGLFFSGSHFLVNTPFGLLPVGGALPPRFNQMHFSAGFGNAEKPGLSVALSTAYDAHLGVLQYTAAQSSYNWDCCGFSVEYRRFALASLRRENQFRFNFTLANVATFGNLKRREQIF